MWKPDLLEELYRQGELQFHPGIQALRPWCQNVISDTRVFTELDANSVIEPGYTVLARLISSCFPQAKYAFHPGMTAGSIKIGHHNTIQFADSRDFLREVSQRVRELNAMVIVQHCFEIQEFGVIDMLVTRFPPFLLAHWNSDLINTEEGKPVELFYSVLGKPTPLFYWCFHGRSVVHSQQAFVDTAGLRHRIGLRISQVGLDDEGEYYCCILKHHDLGFFIRTPVIKIHVVPRNRSEQASGLEHIVSPKHLSSPSFPLTASRKVAMLIGNTQFDHFPRLNDDGKTLQTMEKVLKKFDFEVISLQNLKSDEIVRMVEQFEQALEPGVYGFVYLGSHGLRLHGHEYILATDASLPSVKNSRHINSRAKGNKMSLQELTRHGLISVDAITCRLNSRSPSIAVLVVDACRQDYCVDQATPWTADTDLGTAMQLNFYNPSNLAVLYACQAGAAAYEDEESILCTILLHSLKAYAENPIMTLLDMTCADFSRCQWLKSKPDKSLDPKADLWNEKDLVEQRPDLHLPRSMRQVATPVQVITIAGNTDRSRVYDLEIRGQMDKPDSVWCRKLSDPIQTRGRQPEPDMWICINTDGCLLRVYPVLHSIPEWFHFQYVSNNVLRLNIDVNRTTCLPTAYFELTDMTKVWKPCRVELEPKQSRQYVQLPKHYDAVLIRDLQRLEETYKGIRSVTIQVHRVSLDTFNSSLHGYKCTCTLIPITLKCPPIVRAWHIK